ncbi:YadA-like family protein [Paraburkholderia sp. Ac-20342]|uniref:YadA-like family protein n=1 Tax=Paraburkholderia sp. Ac-20342 TaxID=2703889 RepID=UPI003217C247
MFGAAAYAGAIQAMALGTFSAATQARANAIGTNSTATGVDSNAIGTSAAASGQRAIALGSSASQSSNTTTDATQDTTTNTRASGTDSIAIGTASSATQASSVAIGTSAVSSGSGAVALGQTTKASGTNSIALGQNAAASANNSVALGAGATTTANLGAAAYNPGSSSLSGTASAANGEVSVGSVGYERRVTNVAAGAAATDAVNVSQLQSEAVKSNEIGNSVAASLGGGAAYNSTTGTVSAPSYSVGGTTVGSIGDALGNIDGRTTQNAADIAKNADDIAKNADDIAQNSTSITNVQNQLASGTVGLVQQDETTRDLTVGKDTDGTVVNMAGTAGSRTVTGVAAGVVNASSVDAINGSQLYANSASVASALGGGSIVNEDGTISAPSYSVGGTTVGSIGDALGNIDGRTTQNTADIAKNADDIAKNADDIAQNSTSITNVQNQLASGTVGLVQQDETSRDLTVGKDTDGTVVNMAGTAGNRTVTGVAAGAVNASSVDAINGSQLYANSASVASALGGGSTVSEDGTVSAPSYSVDGTTVNSIGDALGNIDGRTTQNTADITRNADDIAKNATDLTNVQNSVTDLSTQLASGTVGLVQQDETSRDLTVGKDTDGTVVNMAGTAGNRTVTGVAAGAVNASSVDAINGSQLYANSASVAEALGGGSTVSEDGTISAPSYSVGGTTVGNIGDALGNIDGRTTQNAADIASVQDKLADGSFGLVQQDATTRDLTVGKDTDGTVVNMAGTAGNRTVTGVAAGVVNASSVDAINGSQLYANSASVAEALGGGSTVSEDGTVSAPSYSVGGTTVNSIGDALGNIDGRTTQNTADITRNADDIAKNATDLTNVQNSVTDLSTQLASGTAGLVQQDATTRDLTVGKDTDGTVVNMAGTAGNRTVTGVAAGVVNASSVDAINGSQLYANSVSVAEALGGGSTVSEDGTVSAPSYSVDGTTVNSIGDALGNIDGRTTQNTADIAKNADDIAKNTTDLTNVQNSVTDLSTQLASGTVGLVQQDATTRELTVGKDTDGTVVNVAGTAGNRTVTGVAAGVVNASSVDAINGSQLYANSASVAEALGGGSTVSEDGTISAPSYSVGGTTVGSIGDALGNIDGRTTQNAADIAKNADDIAQNSTSITNVQNQLASGTVGLVQQDETTRELTVGKDTDGAVVNMAGTAGNRTVTGVAAGVVNASSVDAINGSQLYANSASVAEALGGGSTVNDDGTVSAPSYSVGGTTVGSIGDALGNIDGRTTQNTADIARNADDITKNADDIARNATDLTNVQNSVTDLSTQLNSGTVGLVQQDATTRDLTVGKDTDGTVVNMAGAAGNRTVTGVAAGVVNASSTDAINGSQLYANSASVASALGGGSTVNDDGTVSAPSYSVGGTTVGSIGDALGNIDGRTTQNTADIARNADDITKNADDIARNATDLTNVQNSVTDLSTQLNSGTVGLVQQDATTRDLTVGKDTDGTVVNMAGAAGNRTVTGVAAGVVNASSTDAINGSQLYANSASVASALGGGSTVNDDGTVSAPSYSVGGTTVGSIGDALGNIDGRTTQNTADIAKNATELTNVQNSVTDLSTQLNSGTVGLVQQDATTRDLTVGKDTDGTVVNMAGTAGDRTVTGVAAGTVNASSTDAINGSQLYANSASVAEALGGGSTVNTDGTVSAPTYSVDGTTMSNIGDALTNIDGRTTQNADQISALNTMLGGINSGSGIMYFHSNSSLPDSVASGANSVAIGGNAQSSAAGSVALGANSVADRDNTVSVGSAGNERQITNVAAGTADTDAVNVAQLKSAGIVDANGNVNAAATYDHNADGSTNYNSMTLGNGSDDGTVIHNVADGVAPTDAVNVSQLNAVVNNAAAAANNPMFSADGDRTTQSATASGTLSVAAGAGASASGSQAVAMGANASATGQNSVALGSGSVADRDNSVSMGSAGNERQVTNVAAGTAPTDAVNVSQMNNSVAQGVQQAKGYTDQRINDTNNAINGVARGAYSGIAAATALTMIPEVDPGKTLSFGIGAGTYKGYQAVALGGTARITENIKVKAGVGLSPGGTTAGIGASMQW